MPDMARRDTTEIPSQQELEEIARVGEAIYYEQFRDRLEPTNRGDFIAIHVDSGDYAIGKSSASATRELLRGRRPDGRIHIQRVGNEPDYALAARILAGELAAGVRK